MIFCKAGYVKNKVHKSIIVVISLAGLMEFKTLVLAMPLVLNSGLLFSNVDYRRVIN
jgi:hypothetical protein